MPPARRPHWLRIAVPALVLIGWLAVGAIGGPYQGRLDEVQRNDNASWPPASAEATRVAEIRKRFADAELLPAIVVYERPGGITEADVDAVVGRAKAAAALPAVRPGTTPPIPSIDRQALQLVIPVSADHRVRRDGHPRPAVPAVLGPELQ